MVLIIWRLIDGLIDIFYVYLDSNSSLIQYLSLLDDQELETYDKYQVHFKKEEFLAGRFLAKTILSKYLETEPEKIGFIKNSYGKLYLKEQFISKTRKPLQFNISHSNNLIALAVTLDTEIGIDVEKVNRPILDIAERFFTLEEKEYLSTFEPGKRNQIAYQIWTLKEAYIKAKGLGLSIPLESINIFSLDKEVFLKSIQPRPGYYMAIAADGFPNQIFQTRLVKVDDLSKLAISV